MRPGLALGKLARQLDALRFAARQGRRGLPQRHVTQADFHQRRQLLLNLRNILEQLQRFRGRQVQHIADRVALVSHRQRFRIVAAAAAHFAHHIHVRQKIHFDAAQSIALASFASPALHIETEASWPVAAFARFRQHGKKIADRRENSGVRRGIRTRSAPDGRLIDLNHFIDLLRAQQFAMRGRLLHRTINFLRQRAIKNVVDQRGFARSRKLR